MTSVTLCAETSFVLIIFLVTSDAGRRCGDLFVHALSMAGITIEPFVSSIEREAGPCIMIEIPEFPVS